MIRDLVASAKHEIALLRDLLRRRAYINSTVERSIVDQFHQLYYDSAEFGKTWMNTFWLGVPTQKCPLDLWIYQEIVCEQKPDIIIESGTCFGGSALFLATICDLVHNGKIITIDIEDKNVKLRHERVTYLHGSSTSDEIVRAATGGIQREHRVMVILDSDHTKDHVLEELRIYSRYVTLGCYLIVEDTNLGGHPVSPEFGAGPMEAVRAFLQENQDFVVDQNREKLYLTFNPGGYLLRIK